MEAEHDGMRQGATQLTQAITSLHDGVDTLNELKKSSKDSQLITALASIATNLDDAGSGISDFSSEPPDLATFKSQFSAQDTRRLSAIDAANDALHDLDEATDALDPFLDHANPEDKDSVDNLESSMEDAQDALIEAIKSLGGKVEDDGTTDLSGDGTTAPDSKAQTSSANSSNQESNSAGSTTGT
jgi:ABC-type transporter Mla subunit MlaD